MMTMNDIIAFIEKAMKENLEVKTCVNDNYEECYSINIYNSNGDVFAITEFGNKMVQMSFEPFNRVEIEMSEMDIALFKVEVLKAQKYSKDKVIEAFNTFFDNKKDNPITINDLDNEDD